MLGKNTTLWFVGSLLVHLQKILQETCVPLLHCAACKKFVILVHIACRDTSSNVQSQLWVHWMLEPMPSSLLCKAHVQQKIWVVCQATGAWPHVVLCELCCCGIGSIWMYSMIGIRIYGLTSGKGINTDLKLQNTVTECTGWGFLCQWPSVVLSRLVFHVKWHLPCQKDLLEGEIEDFMPCTDYSARTISEQSLSGFSRLDKDIGPDQLVLPTANSALNLFACFAMIYSTSDTLQCLHV